MSDPPTKATTALAALVGLCLLAVAAGLLVDRRGLELPLTLAIGGLPALLVLLAVPAGRRRLVAIPAALLLLVLEGALLGVLLARGNGPLGWPRAAAVMLLVLWIAPLPIVALAYAWHFRRDPVDARDLERLRRLADAARRTRGD